MSDEDDAAALAANFEGFRSAPYRDPGGVWTIGFGSTRDAQGFLVTASTPPISRPDALHLLARDMGSAFATIQHDVTSPLTDDERVAIADLIYNIGAGNFARSSVLAALNRGDYAAAAADFALWDRASGRVLAGLVRRRTAEADLFRKSTPGLLDRIEHALGLLHEDPNDQD